jgi:hypothetical protein
MTYIARITALAHFFIFINALAGEQSFLLLFVKGAKCDGTND